MHSNKYVYDSEGFLVCERRRRPEKRKGYVGSRCCICKHYLFIPEKDMWLWYKSDAIVVCEECTGKKAGMLLKQKRLKRVNFKDKRKEGITGNCKITFLPT